MISYMMVQKAAAGATAVEALSNKSNEYMHHRRPPPARTLFAVRSSEMCDAIIYQGLVQLKSSLV